MKKPTKKQLEALVIGLSIQHHQSDLAVKRRRYELNEEYACYFRVRGEIEPGFRGIRPYDPATRVLWRTRRTPTNAFYRPSRDAAVPSAAWIRQCAA